MRAEWDGRTLVTREGNPVDAAEELLESLPQGVRLSGELWAGRGNFQTVLGALRGGAGDARWSQVRFVAFDAPGAGGLHCRLERLARARGVDSVTFYPVRNVLEYTRAVVDRGGEGIVLRSPDGVRAYRVKPLRDAEARVLEILVNGSARCQCEETGADFRLVVPKDVRRGNRVTYTFLARYDTGRPREPQFKAIRNYE